MGAGTAESRDSDATISASESAVQERPLEIVQEVPDLAIDLRFGEVQIVIDGAGAASTLPKYPPTASPPLDVTAPTAAPIDQPLETRLPASGTSGLLVRITSMASAERGPSLVYLGMKRTADLVISGLLTILLMPLAIVIALLVWTTSRGPVLYPQERIGRNGSTYTMLKFRTMTVDADKRIEEMEDLAAAGEVHPGAGPAFKAPDDPRVTKVGRLIRRTGLDELPQLLNIIDGSMSIIGPRPLVAKEVKTLSPADSQLRHEARPGISCIWQVIRTPDMTFDERIALDLLYVHHRSVGVDLRLLFMTPVAILRGEGTH